MSQTQEHAEQAQAMTDSTPPATSADRVARFRADVADMRLRDPKASRERILLFLGVALMVLGILLAIIGYLQSHGANSAYNTEGPATQRDAVLIALSGVTVAIVGAALFLRYSFAQFLRFWLARLIYEQQAAADRIIEGRTNESAS
jgi:small-conductance mechanosensitive channel